MRLIDTIRSLYTLGGVTKQHLVEAVALREAEFLHVERCPRHTGFFGATLITLLTLHMTVTLAHKIRYTAEAAGAVAVGVTELTLSADAAQVDGVTALRADTRHVVTARTTACVKLAG